MGLDVEGTWLCSFIKRPYQPSHPFSIPLGRAEARVLLRQFQEANGVVSATKFLRWIALNPPADHVNPDLLFPQLPQPYRLIKKVLDLDIFDAAWLLITTESIRFKAEAAATDASMNSSRSATGTGTLQQQRNDYDVAKRRTCDPSSQISLDSSAQRVAGLVSHYQLPILIIGVNCESSEDEAHASFAPFLRVLSTAGEEVIILGDISVQLPPVEPHTSAENGVTKVQVSIKALSSLELVGDTSGPKSCRIAVHLSEITYVDPVQQEKLIDDFTPPTPTVRECVNIYTIKTANLLPPSDNGSILEAFSYELVAILTPTQNSVESSIASITLSPGSSLLSVMLVGSKMVFLYSLHEENNQEAEAVVQPLVIKSPTYQVDLEPTRSPFTEEVSVSELHFLVSPVTTRAQIPQVPKTYAFAVCYGVKVLKYLLPRGSKNKSGPSSPLTLTPANSWEHLTQITATSLDMTTQYLVVGCQDGTIVVWDMLQDVDFAFLAPSQEDLPLHNLTPRQKQHTGTVSTEVSSVVFCNAGYIVALSKSQQRLYVFDVRERGKPSLKRVITLPSKKSSTKAHATQPEVFMVSLAVTTVAADIPVALVEFSHGMVMVYDVRTAEAIGSFWMTSTATTSPTAQLASSETNGSLAGVTTIAGNEEVFGVATLLEPSADATKMPINGESKLWFILVASRSPLISIFLVFLFFTLQTILNTKQLVLANDGEDVSTVAPPSVVTLTDTTVDQLEAMLWRMAGENPPSSIRTRQSNAGSLSPLQSPLARSSESIAQLSQNAPSFSFDITIPRVMLEPVVLDDKAFFEEYCRENLDPLLIADKEARLHRKRRELLKTLSAGGA
ncbi:unnamed protein product [Phytophthora fragariaefolia]|uniref:Unnamed protein product n=1 Tax=Phytophthora fragariaefolia TaxID=1490495 RepID=A0A9W6U3F5_9STRA|nr:unnamed protein product [Phytophthora fragariaefolia]